MDILRPFGKTLINNKNVYLTKNTEQIAGIAVISTWGKRNADNVTEKQNILKPLLQIVTNLQLLIMFS